jgi:uncharacterized linocin/CFP29 family protein
MPGNNNQFHWTEARWAAINNSIHAEAAALRKSRRDEGFRLENHSGRLVMLNGPQDGNYVDRITGYAVERNEEAEGEVKPLYQPLRMRSGQTLVPLKIWSSFQLSKQQYDDEPVAAVLASKASYLLALGEDHVLLFGKKAKDKLDKLGLRYEYLDEQAGLITPGYEVAGDKPILDAIIEGIEELRTSNHHGEYCAIVSPDLYRQAFAPRNEAMDAPIYEIRPLLKKHGFTYSNALEPRTGVIFSLGGHTLDMAVPVDARAELEDEKEVVILQVVEQIRLRVNDATAIVPLGEKVPEEAPA